MVGEVYSHPEIKNGTKKDGSSWSMAKIAVRADGSIKNCLTFSKGDIAYINNLVPGDKVFVVGFLKKSKGSEGKWYENVEISFIQAQSGFNPPKAKDRYQDYSEDQLAQTQAKPATTPYDYMPEPPAAPKPKAPASPPQYQQPQQSSYPETLGESEYQLYSKRAINDDDLPF